MQTKGERTRESILDISYDLFARKGFKQVTMKDVCEAANMSRGGLYSHFSSTSQLFEALLERMTDKGAMDFQAAIEKGTSAVAIFEGALKSMEEEIRHPERSLSIAMYEYAQTVDSNVMMQLNRAGKAKWTKLIRYGIDRGEFCDVNVGEIVNMILYSYQGVRMWSSIIPIKPRTFRSITENIKNQLIAGEKK